MEKKKHYVPLIFYSGYYNHLKHLNVRSLNLFELVSCVRFFKSIFINGFKSIKGIFNTQIFKLYFLPNHLGMIRFSMRFQFDFSTWLGKKKVLKWKSVIITILKQWYILYDLAKKNLNKNSKMKNQNFCFQPKIFNFSSFRRIVDILLRVVLRTIYYINAFKRKS